MPRLTSKPLDQKLVDAARPPSTGVTILRDHEQRGLNLRIWPSGKKSWSLEYRSPVSGANSRLTLPAGSLVEARRLAKIHRATLALGKDPLIEAKQELQARRDSHTKAVSVTAAYDLYAQHLLSTASKPKSRRQRLARLKRALSGFTDRKVGTVTRGDLVLRLDEVQTRSGGVARNRAQAELRSFLRWLHARGLIETNPLDRVRMAVKEVPRERVLSDAELKDLVKATSDRSVFSDVVKVLLHTALRRTEAASLQAGDLDFEQKTITVRAEVAKTNRTRTIPMCVAITGILRDRYFGLDHDQYVFGDGSGFARPLSGFSRGVEKLRKALVVGTVGWDRWTLHDIRRTVATRMHEAGGDALVIEDLLGHVSGVRRGVAGVYNRARTLERQRQALETWSATLQVIAT
jgi:integrase